MSNYVFKVGDQYAKALAERDKWKERAEKAEAALQESAAAHVHALTAIGAVRRWAKVQEIESTSRGDYGKRRVFLDLLIVLENNGYGDEA